MTLAPNTVLLNEAARRARRLGVLGGSFDPPHLGHLHAANQARLAFALDHVVFVPAARPPHKPARILADAGERLEMLARLLGDDPALSVWGVELARSGPSYTIDTLRELRAALPVETRLYLLLGTDNLPGLPTWREAEEILRLAQPIVVRRHGVSAPEEWGGLSPFARTRLTIGVLSGATLDASSTELRAELERGIVSAEHFPPRLVEYLRAGQLYRS